MDKATKLAQMAAEVIKIINDNGDSIECTPEHKIWTENRGYVVAKDLKKKVNDK